MSKQATCPICGAEQRDHLVCWLCVGRHRRALSQISDLWGHLIEAVRRDTNLNVRVGVKSVGSEKPLFFAEQAARLRDEAQSALVGWVRITCEDQGIDPPADTIPAICGFLQAQAGWWRKHEAVTECVAEVASIAHRIEAIINPGEGRVPVGRCIHVEGDVSCPGEMQAHLPRDERAPAFIRCDTCTTEWDTTQWARIGRMVS
ncbi:MAG: hypothetical protein IPM11_00710 [Micropruina sp.]|nr:hypothetical protein [Micropruina sp.]